MKQELVRINSLDDIEQPGILYTPYKDTNKIVIHVHGLNGNFYEDRFIDTLAKIYTDKNMAFLTFNNRGRDFITELPKGDNFTLIGGSLESFKDCILDIEGVIKWVKDRGYKKIILEGHSYGCNKVLYYYTKKKDAKIKNIVLLAPCDIPAVVKKFLTEEEYKKAKKEATRLVNEGRGNELIDFSIMANGKISASTFYNDFLPNGENDFFKYSAIKETKNIVLNNIKIPILIIVGSIDDVVLTQPLEIVKKYLDNNIKDCNIEIIKDADHSYTNKYKELGNIITKNI